MKNSLRIALLVLLTAVIAATASGQWSGDALTLTGTPPPAPANLSASYAGAAGVNTYYYWVVAHYVGGYSVANGPAVVKNVGTLAGGNPALIAWDRVQGATGVLYDVLRTTDPGLPMSGSCTCSVATNLTVNNTSDTGGALGLYALGGFPYQNAPFIFKVNNRDYVIPRLELVMPAGSWFRLVNGNIEMSQLNLPSNGLVTWSSTTDPGGTKDAGLARNAAGVVEVNSGTAGTLRDLAVRNETLSGTITNYGGLATAGRGVAVVRAVMALTAQSATIPVGNLYAAAPAGTYKVSTYIDTTTAAGGVCTAAVAIGWTYNGGVAMAKTMIAAHDLNALNTASDAAATIQTDALGNPITRTITLAGAGCAAATDRFDITMVVERLN